MPKKTYSDKVVQLCMDGKTFSSIRIYIDEDAAHTAMERWMNEHRDQANAGDVFFIGAKFVFQCWWENENGTIEKANV